MPSEVENIITRLSREAERLTDFIDQRQRALDRRLAALERQMFEQIRDDLFVRLEIVDGKIANSVANLLLIARLDEIFAGLVNTGGVVLVGEFIREVLTAARLTVDYYSDFDEATLQRVLNDNAVLLAALGISAAGALIAGGIMADIANAAQVRQDIKTVLIGAIKSGSTLSEVTKAAREYVTGTRETEGRLTRHWRTYAYDLFNQAAEVKNEEFRRALNLQWFIYVGDVIRDSRQFCVKKSGKIFAAVEADAEWPKDPDLIGKTSGIPYTPRIDRGRWNCRHRIRYISEELAVQLDPKKVNFVKKKYGI